MSQSLNGPLPQPKRGATRMITVNAANPENGTTQSPSIGRTKYKALNPAAIKYGAAATTPASSRARAAKKSATAAGNKTTARSRACRFEKSARRVTEGSFVGLTDGHSPAARARPAYTRARGARVGAPRGRPVQWRVRPPVVSCDHRPAIARPAPRCVNRVTVDPRRARARLLNVRTESGGTAVRPEKIRASSPVMVPGTPLKAACAFGAPRCRAGARDGSTARRSLVPQPKYSFFSLSV